MLSENFRKINFRKQQYEILGLVFPWKYQVTKEHNKINFVWALETIQKCTATKWKTHVSLNSKQKVVYTQWNIIHP